MAKRVYGLDAQASKVAGKPVVTQKPTRAKHQGYDFIDPQGGKIAKAAARGIGAAVVRAVAGPKKSK